MGLRTKNYGGSLKNPIFNERLTKNNIDLMFGFAKKWRVVFLKEGGGKGGLIPQFTPWSLMRANLLICMCKKWVKDAVSFHSHSTEKPRGFRGLTSTLFISIIFYNYQICLHWSFSSVFHQSLAAIAILG